MKYAIRACAACGAKRPKNEMIRIGAGKDGGIIVTHGGKVAGRGCYVCPISDCVEKAKKRGSVSKALGGNVPDELYGELEILTRNWQKDSIG